MAKQGLIFVKAKSEPSFAGGPGSFDIESSYLYISVDSTQEYGYLGLFPASNIFALDANAIQKELGGDAEVRIFERLLKFEPLDETKPGTSIHGYVACANNESGKNAKLTIVHLKLGRSSCAHIATLDPAEGAEKDFNDWYRLQHLDMLSTCPGYRRSFRYKLLASTREGCPAWTAIHEFESTDLPLKEISFTTKTEWSSKILSEAKAFEAENWEFKGMRGRESDL
ncbi:hypothetical protein LTR84_009282 [Exophiala bonariae]|uniref:Uncharacterized protein n=1 Tax=Exophiala bonariae TaxID=1690606 RepID=A0AAV9MY45_9EURO|nr:hypothetical protein LTR84_009282 [Exophiala bonariae]